MAQQEASNIPTFHLGDRLAKALDHAGIGKAEMADHLGVSRTTVSNYIHLRTSPTRAVLRVWALATGVPFDWLAYGIEHDDPNDPSDLPGQSSPWMTDEPLASVHTLKVAA